jgi:hypothetical protein
MRFGPLAAATHQKHGRIVDERAPGVRVRIVVAEQVDRDRRGGQDRRGAGLTSDRAEWASWEDEDEGVSWLCDLLSVVDQ